MLARAYVVYLDPTGDNANEKDSALGADLVRCDPLACCLVTVVAGPFFPPN